MPIALLPRRSLLLAAGLLVLARPAHALAPELDAAVRAWAGSSVPRPGRITLEVAPLVENGNAVPVRVQVESPMTEASHVQEIVLFNERNPQRDVGRFQLSPASGRADISTRIRLATSQQLIALARFNDGSIHSHVVDVTVTLAACVEG